MKIAICASMCFSKDIMEAKEKLGKLGHEVDIPHRAELYADGTLKQENGNESTRNKIEGDLIRKYFNLIKETDAVLIINKDKHGIKNYVGGNTFLEMGFAHVLNKKVFLLNPIPEIQYKDEIEAMQPIIINGNLSLIK